MNPPLLEMRDVCKAFGKTRALDGVSLSLHGGEVHALIGENGAGKSTLMKVLSGAHRPDSGEMFLNGEKYMPRGPRDARDRGIAMIYQELAVAPHLSVEANIMLGRERVARGMVRRREHRTLVESALALLDHREIDPGAVAGTLSVGAQQLIEVARALVADARVIVFDEPTSSLTEHDTTRLFAVIDRLRAKGIAIVYISHFLDEIRRITQRYTVLRDGRSVGSGLLCDTTLDAIVAQMIGRELTDLFPAVPHGPAETVLEVSDLSNRRSAGRVHFSVRKGEILGIFGLIGAGRTELLRTIFGLDAVRSGTIQIKGNAVRRPSPRGCIERGIGFVSEDRKREGLALGRSIEDNMSLSALGRYARWGFLNLRERRGQVASWMGRLRVSAAGPAQRVRELSGGNQQKIAIARLLHQRADIFLLDEPTRGIDVGSKAEVYRLIGEQAAAGKAVVMVSSYLPELFGICDRIAVMSRGVLSEARPVDEWSEHAVMSFATSG